MIDSNKLVAKPFGKEKASLYVLIDYPDPDDVRFGSLGEGLKSRYLRTFYDGLKFSDYRMNSLVPRVTKKVENGRTISVPPTSLEIYDNLGNVANDIINSGATTILAVGSTVLKTILDDKGMTLRKSHNLVKSVTLGDKKISVIPTYSPTFLSSHGSDIELGSEFYRDLLKSIKLSNGTYVDILDNVEINACKTFSEFKNFVDSNMKDDTTFTFDYETNAIDVHREGFLPVGFSVANKGNSTDRKLRGTYVILDSLDYHMSDEDKKKSLEYVKNMIVNVKDRVGKYKGLDYKKYLNEKKPDTTVGYDDGRTLEGKVIVHNSMYERPATVNIMNYEIPYDDLDDTLVMAKLLLGGKVGAGLKPQAQSIGYPDWETDLNDYMKGFLRLAGSSRKELYKMAVNNRWNDIYSVKYYTRTNVTSYILSHLKDLFTQLSNEFNLSSKQLALVNNESLLTASPEQVDWDVIEAIMKMVDDLVNIKLNTRSVKKSVYLRDKYGDYSKSKLDNEHDDIMKDFKSHYPELVKVSQIYSYSNIYTEALLETVKLKERAKKKGKAPVPNLLESTINFIDLMNEYYKDSTKLKFVLSKVSEKLVEFQSSEYKSIIPYSWIPSNLIEKYGAMDAVATYDVEDNFLRRMVSESNHEVNLFKGYEVYLRQHFMGYVMEQNGMYWNDDAAQKIKNDMNNNAIISMQYMARHPLMKEYFKNKFFDEIAPEIIYENKAINEYFADHYKRKVVVAGKNNQYKMVTLDPVQNDDGTPQVYENGSQVYKESRPLAIKYFFNGAATKTIKIENVEEIDPKIKEFISERVVDKVYELIDSCKYYDDAKEYFNPMSTQGKDYENLHDVMTNILLTDNYKYGSAIYNISALNNSKPSRSDKKDAGKLLEACSEYTNLKRDYEDEDDPEHEKYIKENYVKIKKQKWPELIKLLDEYYVKIGSPTSYEAPRDRKGNIKETHKLYDVFCTSMFPQVFETSKTGYVNYLDSSDGGIISMYQHMKQFPIDLENPNDWKDFPEFTWMYNFRLFKKSAKLITTYVEGRIGRQNVWTVDKKLLQAGELRLPRKILYDDLPKDDTGKAILPEGDALLLQTRFGVNTADTGRWRSGVHTIPAGSFIKKMYTSRYKGGSICMPDFCFYGNTIIKMADGKDTSIEKLYKKLGGDKGYEKEFYVYSYNLETGRPEVSKAHNLHITKYVNELYKVTLDNGSVIETTNNQPYLVKDTQEYRRADELTVGTSIQPINFRYKGMHGETEGKGSYLQFSSHSDTDWEFVHRSVGEKFLNSEQFKKDHPNNQVHVHHDDENKMNNTPDNLRVITNSEHARIHDNRRWKDPKFQKIRSESQHDYIQNRWDNYRDEEIKIRKKAGKSFTDDVMDSYYRRAEKIYQSGQIVSPWTWDSTVDALGLKHLDGESLTRSGSGERYLRDRHAKVSDLMIKVGAPEEYIKEVQFREMIEDRVTSMQNVSKKTGIIYNTGKRFIKKAKTLYNYMENNDLPIMWDIWDNEVMDIIKNNAMMRHILSGGSSDGKPLDKAITSSKKGCLLKSFKKYFKDEKEFHRYLKTNHRVVKIEVVHLEKRVPVYDFEVIDHHNFAIATGQLSSIVVSQSQNEVRCLSSSAQEENMQKSFESGADIHAENAKLIFGKENISHAERRFAKTATFSILYGAAPQSFADNYLDGDIKQAQEIYDRFFSAFPKIKVWREKRFEEVEKTGKVATMTNRFISIKTYDKQNDPYKFEEELRQAGNYPIQGSSSDVAGCTMFQIDQNTRKLNLKDKFFVFIHDSLESDCPPFELLRQVAFQQDILANYATEEFGMICKADMELGYSFGHEITLEKIDSDEDYDEATLVLSGYKDEIEDTVNNWKKVYSVAEITDTDYKDEYQPTDLFFTPRHAMPDKVRIDRQKGEATIHIRYYDE